MEHKEALAEYAHDAWSGWMRYLFAKSTHNEDGTVTIPAWAAERWKRQSSTPYKDLSDREKDSDRHEAARMLAIHSIAERMVMPHYSQGIAGDGPCILMDGEPLTPEQIVCSLNNKTCAIEQLTELLQQYVPELFDDHNDG